VGSANWDSRSLALNFEFMVECYDFQLAESMAEVLQMKRASARELTLSEILSKSPAVNLRNNFFRLFSPYL
jgi:cardiolipin synthase